MNYCQQILTSIHEESGIRSLIDHLLEIINSDKNPENQRLATTILVSFCFSSKSLNLSAMPSNLLRGLIQLLASNDPEIVSQIVNVLHGLLTQGLTLDADAKIKIQQEASQALSHAIVVYKSKTSFSHNGFSVDPNDMDIVLPGLADPRGVVPLLKIFKEGILHANLDIKMEAVSGFRTVVKHSTPLALQTCIMNISGPLFRVVVDRVSDEIKIVIMDILSILLLKVGVCLKPFFPQIHLVFFKGLSDANRIVRIKSAVCIGRYTTVCARLEPFLVELIAFIKKVPNDANNFKETVYFAIRLSLNTMNQPLPEKLQNSLMETMAEDMDNSSECVRAAVASCLGSLCASVTDRQLAKIFHENFKEDLTSDPMFLRRYRSIALRIALRYAFERIYLERSEWARAVNIVILCFIGSNDVQLSANGVKCACYLIKNLLDRNLEPPCDIMNGYSKVKHLFFVDSMLKSILLRP